MGYILHIISELSLSLWLHLFSFLPNGLEQHWWQVSLSKAGQDDLHKENSSKLLEICYGKQTEYSGNYYSRNSYTITTILIESNAPWNPLFLHLLYTYARMPNANELSKYREQKPGVTYSNQFSFVLWPLGHLDCSSCSSSRWDSHLHHIFERKKSNTCCSQCPLYCSSHRLPGLNKPYKSLKNKYLINAVWQSHMPTMSLPSNSYYPNAQTM